MCSSTGFQRHLAEEERVDYARSLLCEGASLLVQGQAAHSAITTRHLHQCLDKFDRALRLAPHLRAHAWERGFVLFYLNRFKEAADQFAWCTSLDPDDCEPFLWRCLCLAKLQGWSAGVAVLDRFTGCDNRLCMMEVLAFYKGHTDLESVLDHASDDCHSAARASFACALYFEARGRGRETETMALPLLSAVASVDCGGDTYLRSLARIHMHHVRQGLMRDAPLQQNKRTNHRKVNGVLQLSSTPSSLSSSSSSSTSSSSLESLASLASLPSITVGKEGGMGKRGLGVISVYTTVSPPVCRSPSKPALFRTALVKNSC